MAYSDISTFKDLHISSINPREALLASIRQGKGRYKETQSISLPPLIVCLKMSGRLDPLKFLRTLLRKNKLLLR